MPPLVAAIVNPRDGRTWDARGKAMPCPLSREERGQALRFFDHDPEGGSFLRLVLFRSRPSGSKTSGLLVTAPGLTYNSGTLPRIGTSGVSGRFDVYGARVTSAVRPLTLDATYDAGASRIVVELRFEGGRMRVLKGGERRPKVVQLSKGYDYGPGQNPRPASQGYTSQGPATVVSFDYKRGDYDHKTSGATLTDRRGRLLMLGGTSDLHQRYHTFLFEPRYDLGRFVYSARPNATRRFIVPMRPVTGSAKKGVVRTR